MDSRLKDSLSSSGSVEYTSASLSQCIHVAAVKQIIEPLDAIDGITVEADLSGKSLHKFSVNSLCLYSS